MRNPDFCKSIQLGRQASGAQTMKAKDTPPQSTDLKGVAVNLSDKEFELFRAMIYDAAGISLSSAKKALVAGRLAKRVNHYGLKSYAEYFAITKRDRVEFQTAVDTLTTNETYFFREIKHFEFLRNAVFPGWHTGERRIWSAASSSGEEAYSIAMDCQEHLAQTRWQIIGTDISTQILELAKAGSYPMARARNIPEVYLKKYCLRGLGDKEGTFLVDPMLRRHVRFQHENLMMNLAHLGEFDVIFLRNVMIYFDLPTKMKVVSEMVSRLKRGGYLMIGHSESLNGITTKLNMLTPSIYQLPM